MAALPMPYYYGYEAEQFSFYRIPKRLFEDGRSGPRVHLYPACKPSIGHSFDKTGEF